MLIFYLNKLKIKIKLIHLRYSTSIFAIRRNILSSLLYYRDRDIIKNYIINF